MPTPKPALTSAKRTPELAASFWGSARNLSARIAPAARKKMPGWVMEGSEEGGREREGGRGRYDEK
jgi:hypothetical protein